MSGGAAPGGRIIFYFDFISPYAYLAWTQLPALAARFGLALEPIPVLFAALLDAHGTKGPAEVPAKRLYTFKDAVRKADLFGVPLSPPPAHPFNPLLGLRLVLAAAPADRARVIDALYAATWGGGPGISDPEATRARIAAAGLDAPALAAAAASDAVKAALRANTEAALARGVFGVPSMIAPSGELFWGVDALPLLERALAGRDPVTPELVLRFRDLPVESVRKAVR